MTATKLQTRLVALSGLRCHGRNPRAHSEEQLDKLAGSLKHFGQQKAIVLAENKQDILAGNGTFLAAQRLGWEKLSAHVSKLTREEALAYMVADNRTAEGSSWGDSLMGLLEELSDASLLQPTGFTADDMTELLGPPLERDPIEVSADPPEGTPSSNARVVELFFDEGTEPLFMGWVKALAGQHGTANVTDTVAAVVESAFDRMGEH